LDHYFYIEREANERLRQFSVAKVEVTLVTLVRLRLVQGGGLP
jgi:hypothetical protein